MKTKFICLLAFAAALCSCTKEYPTYVTEEYNTYYSLNTVVINVKASDWEYSNIDNNNYFCVTVDMPEITKSVCQTGLVKMYRVYDDFDRTGGVQAEMPFSRHIEEPTESGDWVFYTESLDYEFEQGKITIFYTQSDFYYELDATEHPIAMQFRCVILE